MSLAPGVLLAAACLALAVPLLLWATMAQPQVAKRRTLTNLRRGFTAQESSNDGPELQRGGLVDLAERATPVASLKLLDRLLAQAGRPAAWPLERIIVLKMLTTAGALGFASLMVTGAPTVRSFAIWGLVVVFVWLLPELLLFNTGTKRRQQMELALPDMMDQLTIAVEAGLGFEAALAHVSQNSRGPLADEWLRTLQDIQVGQPRKQAYQALTERANVTDLRRFVRAIMQAEQHGVSVARVLATQAAEMRIKRRQRAEEKAMQIPVKVIFPLILFIMPALFIVLLGPAVINAIETFS